VNAPYKALWPYKADTSRRKIPDCLFNILICLAKWQIMVAQVFNLCWRRLNPAATFSLLPFLE
jgi:hypothetical protein